MSIMDRLRGRDSGTDRPRRDHPVAVLTDRGKSRLSALDVPDLEWLVLNSILDRGGTADVRDIVHDTRLPEKKVKATLSVLEEGRHVIRRSGSSGSEAS